MNYSLSKSQIGTDKAQKAQMVPCQVYRQAQINTDKHRLFTEAQRYGVGLITYWNLRTEYD